MGCFQGDSRVIPIKCHHLPPRITLKNKSVRDGGQATPPRDNAGHKREDERGGQKGATGAPPCSLNTHNVDTGQLQMHLVFSVVSGLCDPIYSTSLPVESRFSMQITLDSVPNSSMEQFTFRFPLPPARSSSDLQILSIKATARGIKLTPSVCSYNVTCSYI